MCVCYATGSESSVSTLILGEGKEDGQSETKGIELESKKSSDENGVPRIDLQRVGRLRIDERLLEGIEIQRQSKTRGQEIRLFDFDRLIRKEERDLIFFVAQWYLIEFFGKKKNIVVERFVLLVRIAKRRGDVIDFVVPFDVQTFLGGNKRNTRIFDA